MSRLTRTLGLIVCFASLSAPSIFADDDQASGPWKVVNYWSITCAPCRVEIPELNRLHDEFEPRETLLVGVNFDDDERARTMMLADRLGIRFPTLRRDEVEKLGVTDPSVLPTTVILAPDGTEKARLVGAQTRDDIQQQLRALRINE